MNTYLVYEVVTKAYAFEVKADSEPEARQKLEDSLWDENSNDIIRCPGYDKTIDRTTESTGVIGEPEGKIATTV